MNEPTNPRENQTSPATSLTRRKFLRSGIATGTALHLITEKSTFAQDKSDTLNLALIGCGAQGNALYNAIRKDTEELGVRFVAVCDIWEKNRHRMGRLLKRVGHPVEEYQDVEDMLAKNKSIDACIIATPDFMHAPHTEACLNAPQVKAVYCEKMMSNTVEAAADMVRAQRSTGKLLQIGHQRRSNPRYTHVHDKLINGNQILGRVTHAYGQWNRAVTDPLGTPKNTEISPDILKKYGYDSMSQFRNWRWYSKYGGGPISDLGAHQIDLFNWMFNATPKSVIASGGNDYYENYEFPDNVMCIYEYDVPGKGISRAYYQVLTTTGSQGFYEKFMGENGTIAISENDAVNQIYREAHAPSWAPYAKQGLVRKIVKEEDIHHKFWEHPKPWYRPSQWLDTNSVVDVRETAALDPWENPVELNKLAHNPHVSNFINITKKGGLISIF